MATDRQKNKHNLLSKQKMTGDINLKTHPIRDVYLSVFLKVAVTIKSQASRAGVWIKAMTKSYNQF